MSDSSSDEDDEENFLDLDEQQLDEQKQAQEKLLPTEGAPSPRSRMTTKPGQLAPLPGEVATDETDLAAVEQLVSGSVASKYMQEQSTESKVPDAGTTESTRPPVLRAQSIHIRRGSITEKSFAAPQPKGWANVQKALPGAVKLSAKDHQDVAISYWEFDQEHLRARSDIPPGFGGGGLSVEELQPFLEETVNASSAEREKHQKRVDALAVKERRELRKRGYTPKAESCRWFHLQGVSHRAVDVFAEAYKLDATVASACKAVSGKPICSWHQTDEKAFDHLFVAAHYIQKSTEQSPDGISGFVYEQVFMVFYPGLNTIISIDANGKIRQALPLSHSFPHTKVISRCCTGEKEWDGVTDLLRNECGFVRTVCLSKSTVSFSHSSLHTDHIPCYWAHEQNEDSSVLIYKLLDSMIDEVYPLLDLYGDLLENLEFETMAADEPTDLHVRTSFKLKRRVHSLRRYAWGMRQLLQELRQNNFGVISKETIKMMTSVERNSENMVEVACAYMEQCVGIEAFYDSFQVRSPKLTVAFSQSSYILMSYRVVGAGESPRLHALHPDDLFCHNHALPASHGPLRCARLHTAASTVLAC